MRRNIRSTALADEAGTASARQVHATLMALPHSNRAVVATTRHVGIGHGGR